MIEINPNWRKIRNIYEKINNPFQIMALRLEGTELDLIEEMCKEVSPENIGLFPQKVIKKNIHTNCHKLQFFF